MSTLLSQCGQAVPTQAEFHCGLALLPGAVTLDTTDSQAGLASFTASAVRSVNDSPPMMLMCMSRSLSAHQFFRLSALQELAQRGAASVVLNVRQSRVVEGSALRPLRLGAAGEPLRLRSTAPWQTSTA